MFDRKIRIGLLVQGKRIPAWTYSMLKRVIDSECAEVVLVVRKKVEPEQASGFIKSLMDHPKEAMFRIFRKLDKRRFKARPDAFESKDLWELIDCPELEVEAKSTRFSDRVKDEDISRIKSFEPDLFIRMGFNILRGDILKAAKYGIWSYHHGDNHVNRGGPAGTWEVLEGWNETGALLQILNEDLDGGVKLSQCTMQTNKKSLILNRNTLYWRASGLLPRKIKELHRLGEERFFQKVEEDNLMPSFYYNRLYKVPTNAQMLPVFIRSYWGRIRQKIWKRFYFEQWVLMFQLKKRQRLSSSFFRFKRILPPKDRIWADPFVLERNGKYFIFIEELLLKGPKKGHISVIELNEKGEYTEPQRVLETDFHLSYPFLLEEGEELYMIPESNDNKTIDIYKCMNFPDRWEHCHTIMKDVVASDTTIFKKDGKYWLFTNIREVPGATTFDELFLFYSDDLFSDQWIPHPLNPVVTQVNCARPAGNLFMHNGRLLRPAQDNSGHYGRGMCIREIVKMNESEFEEETVQFIEPNWAEDLKSTHTINSSGRLTVIDGLIKRRR